MALTPLTTVTLFATALLLANTTVANWCVARSDASDQALQTALDYACWAGADCAPIQVNGLCFLPNTMPAHASYAFNSYFQRKNMAPGSCDFSGTATVAKTDPSYGSCVYPSSPSTAGGTITPGGPGINTPTTLPMNAPPPPFGGATPLFSGGGFTPGMGPPLPTTDNYSASSKFSAAILVPRVVFILLLYVLFCLPPNVLGV